MPGATSCFPSVALGQVEMWRIVMGPQEGPEHTQLLSVDRLHKSPMPGTAVSEQPGQQEKEASLASLPRSQACRRKYFISEEGTLPGLLPGELGHLSVPGSPVARPSKH